MKETYFKDRFSTYPIAFIKKGNFLLKPGEQSNKIYYVETGCLRSYIIDSKGKEHVYQFAPEDWIISDEEAILNQTPSTFFIDAIEDSMVRVISSPGDLAKSEMDPEFARSTIKKLHNKISSLKSRIIFLLSATAEERYAHFTKTYPGLLQRVPLKMIASYLGIAPESLSRIRKGTSGKK